MDTDYDRIAEQYQRARLQPWRTDTHIEAATRCSDWPQRRGGEGGDRPGLRGGVLHPRALRQQGARIVGVDLSRADDWALAEAEEGAAAAGRRRYRVGDVRTLEVPGEFDLAFAAIPAQLRPLGRGAGANVPGGGPRREARRAFQ